MHIPTLPDATPGIEIGGSLPSTALRPGSASPLRRPWRNPKPFSNVRNRCCAHPKRVFLHIDSDVTCAPLDRHRARRKPTPITASRSKIPKLWRRPGRRLVSGAISGRMPAGQVRQLPVVRQHDRHGPNGLILTRLLARNAPPRPRSFRPFPRWRTAFRRVGPPFDPAAPPLPGTGPDLGRRACDHMVVVVPVRHRPRLRDRDGTLAALAPGDGLRAGGPRRTTACHLAPAHSVAFGGASDRRHRPLELPLPAAFSQGVRILSASATLLQHYYIRGSTPHCAVPVGLGKSTTIPHRPSTPARRTPPSSRRTGSPPPRRPRGTRADEPPPAPS